jgi:hypothetical protein
MSRRDRILVAQFELLIGRAVQLQTLQACIESRAGMMVAVNGRFSSTRAAPELLFQVPYDEFNAPDPMVFQAFIIFAHM